MARRKTEVFSMSFLDCITCAFGSVVLVYTLINVNGGLRRMSESHRERAEGQQDSRSRCSRVISSSSCCATRSMQTHDERVRTEGLGTRVIDETERLKVQLADSDKETLSMPRSDRTPEGGPEVPR